MTVVAAKDGAPAHMVVPRGVIVDKDTFIPLDAITHRVQGRVFVNAPKLVLGTLPWDQPPTAQSAQSKLGPPAADVAMLYRTYAPSGV